MASPLENETLTAPTKALSSPLDTNTPTVASAPPPLPQIAAGELPAALVPPLDENLMSDPMIAGIIENFGQLGAMGIDYYETADQSTVLFNPKLVTEAQLKEAEQNGTLPEIAPPVTAIGEAEAAPAAPLANAPMPGSAPAGEPRLNTARMRNINDGPQVSPIQPNPITQQLSKRPI